MVEVISDAARKRRIAMRNLKRSSTSEDELVCENKKRLRMLEKDDSIAKVSDPDEVISTIPHVTGIKNQSRYEPGVPMTREELKAWRKEARRVRNRESAAASRQKNRERITELEVEVDLIKSKYAAALKLIIDIEASRSVNDFASFTPPTLLRQDLLELRGVARPSSPDLDASQVQTVSPPASPATVSPLASCNDLLSGINHHHEQQQEHSRHQFHQHIIDMISRPIACV